MKILILDDNNLEATNLEREINIYSEKKKLDITIKLYNNPNKVINDINNFDLAFLDVKLNSINGVDLALKIRKFNSDIKIIFISNYSEYLIDGYKAHADRYFLKPINQYEFEIEMDDIISDYQFNNMGFYDKNIYCNKLYYRDILYIEFLQRKSHVHILSGKIIDTNIQLKEWLKILKEYHFSRVHKSYIVNLANISEYGNKSILLINNESIPLSKSFYDSFENDFIILLHKRV